MFKVSEILLYCRSGKNQGMFFILMCGNPVLLNHLIGNNVFASFSNLSTNINKGKLTSRPYHMVLLLSSFQKK